MKNLKKIYIILMVSLIAISAFIGPLSKANNALYCYADDITDEWYNVTTVDEMAEAFRYYCKSRDLTIDGSIADGVTKFTTKTFNGLCNTLGIDMTGIQANLKYNVDSNGVKRFLFSNGIISTYNRIFAQFLQDNELSVGDSADEQDNTLYNGAMYTDPDGYTCLIYTGTTYSGVIQNPSFVSTGTVYKYNSADLFSIYPNNVTFHYYNVNGNLTTLTKENRKNGNNYYLGNTYNQNMYKGTYTGDVIVYRNNTTGNLYIGLLNSYRYFSSFGQVYPQNNNVQNTNIYLTTNNSVINNNIYEGDTIINYYGEPEDDNPDEPEGPQVVPNPDPPTGDPDNWGIELPDMNINWILTGMENKFPWDIPFNLLFCMSLLNATPEAPHWEGEIDLGIYTWEIDFDLSPYENWARIIRELEFLGFMVGLMILTKQLIWG